MEYTAGVGGGRTSEMKKETVKMWGNSDQGEGRRIEGRARGGPGKKLFVGERLGSWRMRHTGSKACRSSLQKASGNI